MPPLATVDKYEEKCPICKDEFGERILSTPSCGHHLHTMCLERVKRKATEKRKQARCPVCGDELIDISKPYCLPTPSPEDRKAPPTRSASEQAMDKEWDEVVNKLDYGWSSKKAKS